MNKAKRHYGEGRKLKTLIVGEKKAVLDAVDTNSGE